MWRPPRVRTAASATHMHVWGYDRGLRPPNPGAHLCMCPHLCMCMYPHPGAHTVFLATDSEVVLRDARTLFPKFTFLYAPNISRTGLSSAAPTVILDEVIKKRARTGVDIASTQRDALLGGK